ncbi:hypothetical protein HDV00_004976 [Rhizophlyctis rosea]|nr:hypothetical protein HDV00_004976 [Rhizophlyctis rosea]
MDIEEIIQKEMITLNDSIANDGSTTETGLTYVEPAGVEGMSCWGGQQQVSSTVEYQALPSSQYAAPGYSYLQYHAFAGARSENGGPSVEYGSGDVYGQFGSMGQYTAPSKELR